MTDTKICSKAEPHQVWSHGPSCDFIYLSPDVGEVASDTGQEDDVSGSFDWALELEEERHPDEVETELDGV